jgi:Rieske 2Fe-2S family protein
MEGTMTAGSQHAASAPATSRRLQPALPKEMYVGREHWLRERDEVLAGSWVCVGRLDDLGLDARSRLATLDVLGESVLITRASDGQLHGAYNVCRHRGCQLVAREPEAPPDLCSTRSLRCPYHSWTYALDGRLIKAPHTGDIEDFNPADFSLEPIGVDTWGGFVFVHLIPAAATPLAESVVGVADRLRRYPLASLVSGRRLSYHVAANWKVVAENYNECYHCGPVHPELTRLVPSFRGGGGDVDWDAGVPHREGAWTFTATGTTTRARFPDLDPDERVRHKGELLYPNLLLSCSADHVAAFVLWPLAQDSTRVECDLLFAADEVAKPGFDPDDAVQLWDLVNRQDWAVCESVQRGMSSRAYTQGWFAPMEDWSLDIRRWLLPRLGEHG